MIVASFSLPTQIVTVAELAMKSPYASLIKELNPTFEVPKRPFKSVLLYYK